MVIVIIFKHPLLQGASHFTSSLPPLLLLRLTSLLVPQMAVNVCVLVDGPATEMAFGGHWRTSGLHHRRRPKKKKKKKKWKASSPVKWWLVVISRLCYSSFR
ncbi:hypothetical protein TYRP_013897 [Tyrophagus putrescentiae]|nr:hypothetical protein TYRP_013897 [Tyrophagus putrescentiae]